MRIVTGWTVLLLLVAAVPASAVVYRWINDKGVVNYAEDYGKVPEKYRTRVKIVGEEEEQPASAREPAGEKGVGTPVSPVKAKDAPAPAAKKKKIFGGRDEETWREDFARAKGDLKSVRDQLDGINSRMTNTDQMSRTEYKSLESTRKLFQEREATALKRLESLTTEANRASVPQELR